MCMEMKDLENLLIDIGKFDKNKFGYVNFREVKFKDDYRIRALVDIRDNTGFFWCYFTYKPEKNTIIFQIFRSSTPENLYIELPKTITRDVIDIILNEVYLFRKIIIDSAYLYELISLISFEKNEFFNMDATYFSLICSVTNKASVDTTIKFEARVEDDLSVSRALTLNSIKENWNRLELGWKRLIITENSSGCYLRNTKLKANLQNVFRLCKEIKNYLNLRRS